MTDDSTHVRMRDNTEGVFLGWTEMIGHLSFFKIISLVIQILKVKYLECVKKVSKIIVSQALLLIFEMFLDFSSQVNDFRLLELPVS